MENKFKYIIQSALLEMVETGAEMAESMIGLRPEFAEKPYRIIVNAVSFMDSVIEKLPKIFLEMMAFALADLIEDGEQGNEYMVKLINAAEVYFRDLVKPKDRAGMKKFYREQVGKEKSMENSACSVIDTEAGFFIVLNPVLVFADGDPGRVRRVIAAAEKQMEVIERKEMIIKKTQNQAGPRAAAAECAAPPPPLGSVDLDLGESRN